MQTQRVDAVMTMPLDELRSRVERLEQLQAQMSDLVVLVQYCPMDADAPLLDGERQSAPIQASTESANAPGLPGQEDAARIAAALEVVEFDDVKFDDQDIVESELQEPEVEGNCATSPGGENYSTVPTLVEIVHALHACIAEMRGLFPTSGQPTAEERARVAAETRDVNPDDIEALLEATRPPPRLPDTAPTVAEIAWRQRREAFERWQLMTRAELAIESLMAEIHDGKEMIRARIERFAPWTRLERRPDEKMN